MTTGQRLTAEREAEIRDYVRRALSLVSQPIIGEVFNELDAVRRERDEKECERDAWKDNAEQWARERDEARKDSARLDWLADNRREIGLYSPTDASPIWMIVLPDTRPDTMRDSMTLNGESILCPNVVVQATTLRDVIDAAMAKDGDA